MKILEIKSLFKSFDVDHREVKILEDINLTVRQGEFVTIVGHSGCGKSTLLKIIAGLVDYQNGTVTYDGRPLKEPDTDRGMVFQEHRLLPWLKIKDNVGFGLKDLSVPEREKRVSEYLKLVQLEGFENAYPKQLSGGMAQRAAIARGLATNPEILLLDEPFGALDALTRIQMQQEILRIWRQEKRSMIMVTHDIDEAIYLGERIVVMSARPGKIRTIIDASSPKSSDRGSAEFAAIKREVYGYFFENEDALEVEYYI